MSEQGIIDRARQKMAEDKKPPLYRVLLHNDDYTPMDFVVALLIKVFHHSHAKANVIMMNVHTKGYGIAGLFTCEVAETKMEQVLAYARQYQHPLQCSIEPES